MFIRSKAASHILCLKNLMFWSRGLWVLSRNVAEIDIEYK